jgi:acetyl-CoA synthetase
MSDQLVPIPVAVEAKTLVSPLQYEALYRRSIDKPEEFWREQARIFLDWDRPFSRVLKYDYYKAQIEWFGDGKLNVSTNCLDRHIAAGRGEKKAIIWEGNEPGEERSLTYSELSEQVNRFASGLRALGANKGDRVAIYMPMVPELAIAMLSCARIGLVHSVIFAGFSAESVRDRILDSQSRFVITADFAKRAAKEIPLKQIVDQALQGVDCVSHVIVYKRTGTPVAMTSKRDLWFSELIDNSSSECEAESLDAEHPLFILYTSGSTGKPKGVLHTQAGYLLYAAFTHKYVFDYHDDDIYFCAADVGWITGHSYIVYGPLANGATSVMFESTPLYPDPGRYWSVIERLKVSIFYTAPTALRTLQKEGDDWVKKYDRSSLRILGSVGEPINEDAWRWYYSVVGEERCAVVDTWWQTETGGIMIAPLPGATRPRPGYATRPLFGIQPVIVNESGVEMVGNDVEGRLCIAFPWPGQMRTIYGDQQRFFDNYFSQYPGKYFTGDGCIRDANGYYRITGRVDDVLNVSGHRLGTAELESAIISSGDVVESAIVGFPHTIKGTGIYAFCVLKQSSHTEAEIRESIKAAVRNMIGSFAVPDKICIVQGLPKTRSGKIMRRILRKIAEGEFVEFGDISTLAEPSVVVQIVDQARQV